MARPWGQAMWQKRSNWFRVGLHAEVRLAGCNKKKNESATGAARFAAWVGVSETVYFAPIEAGQAGLRLAQKFKLRRGRRRKG